MLHCFNRLFTIRHRGCLRTGTVLVLFFSGFLLIFSFFEDSWIRDVFSNARELLVSGKDFNNPLFDAGIFTDIFLVLWGVNQALIMFYLEHRKDSVLGISLERIISYSMGKYLTKAVLIAFFLEMFCWIIGIGLRRHFFLAADMLLQMVNMLAIFVVIHVKQKPDNILATCSVEVRKKKTDFLKGIITNPRQNLLMFDLLYFEKLQTTVEIEQLREILLIAFAASEIEMLNSDEVIRERRRFIFELYLTERLCEISSDRSGFGIPEVVVWLFEEDDCLDEFSIKVILYHLVKNRRNYTVEAIIKLLGVMKQKMERYYAWCGIWSIYWNHYTGSGLWARDIMEYKKKANGASVSYWEFLPTMDYYKNYIINSAIMKWEREKYIG